MRIILKVSRHNEYCNGGLRIRPIGFNARARSAGHGADCRTPRTEEPRSRYQCGLVSGVPILRSEHLSAVVCAFGSWSF